jgi:hypothetical protein
VCLLIVVLLWIVWIVGHKVINGDRIDLLADLPRNGVVAADVGRAEAGGSWLVTSGTLLTRRGHLWSGRPDGGPADPATGRTGSAVLRAVSLRRDFTDASIHGEMRVDALVSTERTPEHTWDGVHLFLRYRDADNLYVVDLLRRDGTLSVKRKSTSVVESSTGIQDDRTRSSEDGIYRTLVSARVGDMSEGWHRFDVTIRDTAGGVALTVSIDERQWLSTTDSDPSALRGPGRVGLRGDNADFTVRRFDVRRNG